MLDIKKRELATQTGSLLKNVINDNKNLHDFGVRCCFIDSNNNFNDKKSGEIMANYKSALQDNNVDLQGILDVVNALPEGTQLPELTNPATADIIPSGYQAIDRDGNLIEGTGTGLGDATAADVASGKTFTSAAGLKVVGTLVEKLGNKTYLGTVTFKIEAAANGNNVQSFPKGGTYFSNTFVINAGDIAISKTSNTVGIFDDTNLKFFTPNGVKVGEVLECYR